jgi:saccharopine dehydrogenase-like NADP-dependent oxidoreductase
MEGNVIVLGCGLVGATMAVDLAGDSSYHVTVADISDRTDRRSGTSSMARTTGFPCTIVARMLAGGELNEAGVFPLELLARRGGLFDHMTSELSDRGVTLTQSAD